MQTLLSVRRRHASNKGLISFVFALLVAASAFACGAEVRLVEQSSVDLPRSYIFAKVGFTPEGDRLSVASWSDDLTARLAIYSRQPLTRLREARLGSEPVKHLKSSLLAGWGLNRESTILGTLHPTSVDNRHEGLAYIFSGREASGAKPVRIPLDPLAGVFVPDLPAFYILGMRYKYLDDTEKVIGRQLILSRVDVATGKVSTIVELSDRQAGNLVLLNKDCLAWIEYAHGPPGKVNDVDSYAYAYKISEQKIKQVASWKHQAVNCMTASPNGRTVVLARNYCSDTGHAECDISLGYRSTTVLESVSVEGWKADWSIHEQSTNGALNANKTSISFAGNGRVLIASGEHTDPTNFAQSGELVAYDASTGRRLASLERSECLTSMAIDAEGRYIATIGNSKKMTVSTLRVWSVAVLP